MWIAYIALAIVMAVLAVVSSPKGKRHAWAVFLPVLFFLLHVSYGLGTLKSIFC